ncbi:hypothetical protein VE01_05913 [Pseudogymnoascus verrucosus]|uniref:DUF4246 domain-containing protein n=1 Tax=Pseudogymnoascus verrucosus TaxID=342668 RepID=A0A1B8GIC0_9PEZI|nr:uncharacterized protein VE01_05913 [Pseudogymnoascus verrucosus]OBT95580.1 hypothetical protein VE01_05913 [Pseudogymnoascus verrucosus]
MLQLMRNLTDKRDWNIDVFNDEIVAKWREEAFKAQDGAEIALVSDSLRLALKNGIAQMIKKLHSDQDQTLLNPSLFPLVFGKTLALTEG